MSYIEFNRDSPEEIEKSKEFEKLGWYIATGMAMIHPGLRASLMARCDPELCPDERLIHMLKAVQGGKKEEIKEAAEDLGVDVNGDSVCQSIVDQLAFYAERKKVKLAGVKLSCKLGHKTTAKEYAAMLREAADNLEKDHETLTAEASKREASLRGP